MRFPEPLIQLLEEGLIEDVVRPLLSGKEAQIYLVIAGGEQRVAKIYKEAHQRSFKHRADYTEGRRVRNSRDQRAMAKRTRYGKAQDEAGWRVAEVEFIYKLRQAGVRVPEPFLFAEGVLVMELITDKYGEPAPRLSDAKLSHDAGRKAFRLLLRETTKMLCAGVVHGDLSDFNILMGQHGPVIIDFPQAIDAAGNSNAKRILLRDVANLSRFVSRFDSAEGRKPYAEEMWDLYESNLLTPQTRLTGRRRVVESAPVDVVSILDEIAEIERESRARRTALGLEPVRLPRKPAPVIEESSQADDGAEQSKPRRRRRRRRGGGSGGEPRATNGATSDGRPARAKVEVDKTKATKPRRPRRRRQGSNRPATS